MNVMSIPAAIALVVMAFLLAGIKLVGDSIVIALNAMTAELKRIADQRQSVDSN